MYNGVNLVKGKDYTVNGNTYTFTAEFIKTLEAGSHKITFDMASGSDPVFTLTVKGDAPSITIPKVGNTKTTLTIGNPSMTVGEVSIQMDVAPYIDPTTGRTLVPVRFIATALGISDNNISWNSENRTVTIIHGGKIVVLAIDSNVVKVTKNGVTVEVIIDQPAVITNDRTFVPFRAVAEIFDCLVGWDETTKTVSLEK